MGAAGGVVVVAAAAITGGLLWGARGPAAEAAPDDAYDHAPGCAAVPAELVEEALPGGQLTAESAGPLPEAASSSCAWSSVEAPDGQPRTLTVAFHVHFGDRSGTVSGQSRAEAELAALARVSGGPGAAAVPSLGEDALIRPGAVGSDAAEVVFRDGNLVVRLWYGGPHRDEARDGAVAVAEGIARAL